MSIEDSHLRVQGLSLGARLERFRGYGYGFVLGILCFAFIWVLGFGFWVLGSGFSVLGFGFWI